MIEVISSAFAKQCIYDNNLLRVDSIKLFGQGFDNYAFLVNEKYIFRFPKRDEASQLLLNENNILPHLDKIVSLQVPNLVFRGNPTKNYPYFFHGYEILEGLSAYQVALSDDALKECLQSLAHFLVKLHSVKAVQAQGFGAEVQMYDKTTVCRVIESLKHRVMVLQNKKVVELDNHFIKNQTKLFKNTVIPHDNDCLVHGDLDFRHLLLQDKKLVGVIDWGDVGVNHPVVDYVIVHQMFPASMHEMFFNIYGPVDQEIWLYARFLALHRSITLMLLGCDIDDQALLNAAKKSYARLRDES